MKLLNVLLISVIAAGLSACTGIQLEVVVPATPTGDGAVAAVAASPTPVPTATLGLDAEPTDAPTLAPTQTPLPPSTATPTNTPMPAINTPTRQATVQATIQAEDSSVEVDDSDQLLRLGDLGPGFVRLDPAEMGLSEETLGASPFVVEEVFAFYNADEEEFIGGGTTRLAGFFDQAGFDLMLGNPELITSLVLSNMGNIEISRVQDLPIPPIGDNSAGLTVVADVEGESMRANVVMFRKGVMGVALIQLHSAASVPAVLVTDLAQTVADRVQ